MRIRTKLVLLLTGAVTLTMALATWLRVALTRRELETDANQRAREVADEIRHTLQALPPGSTRFDFAQILQAAVSEHRTLIQAELDMHEGPVQSHYVASPGQKRPVVTQGQLAGARAWEPLNVIRTRRVAGQRLAVVSVQVDPEGPLIGVLTTRTSLDPVDRMIATQEVVSLEVTAGAILILAIVIGVIGERVVAHRLRRLGDAMAVVERGDLTSRVLEQGAQDELGNLAAGFNRMITRLGEADAEIRAWGERLAAEVAAATRDLQDKNAALAQLNRLLVETRRELGDKERLAALGQLAAQLAHEIGTPLGSVSGHLQLALSNRDCPPGLRDRLGVAIREVGRVGRIVRDYLDSTRPAQPTLVPARIDRIIDEAIELARSAKEAAAQRPSTITIDRRVDPQVATVRTDAGLLRQILVNLIVNALDAVAGRGHIEVEALADGASALVRVRDSGSGIEAEHLARIFEPFYSTKGRGKGTGLGLSICRELAHALGGRISVASEPGKGSLFTLALPRSGAEPGAEGGAESAA
jgi:signal transduction histidine kinase